MIDPDSVNNYCDEVMQLLATQQDDDEDDVGITDIALDDPLLYLTRERSCRGQFEDCTSWELDDPTVKCIFAGSDNVQRPSGMQKMETNREALVDPCKEKPTNLPGIKRVGSVALEEISRRVFAPPSKGFTPKVPTMANSNNVTGPVTDIARENKADGSNFRTAKDELQIQNIKVFFMNNQA